ncbi:MAG: serine/threonine-protein kinase, partial [Gammaproteobacteria bacterium]|nr:serine/threonine-protein kinase [Gammaproteobacteria bacterium]
QGDTTTSSTSTLGGIPVNIEDLKDGDTWMDRYRIKKEIGRGAMGRVMLAEDEMVGEMLILKFMLPELTADSDSMERFSREVKYSRKVSHNNVIRIHDLLSKDGLSAISMEYFESRGIDEILKEVESFDVKSGLKILYQVCEGMVAAHNQQVIHRDLKPSNILMDETGLVKVVDFGIASVSANADSSITQVGSIIGTPAYLSPERSRGKEADYRCDIYALGIIAYCMFTGQLPYRGETMAILFQHIEGKAPPIHEVNNSIDLEVSKLVQKIMAAKVENRFQTMQEVSDAIKGQLQKL